MKARKYGKIHLKFAILPCKALKCQCKTTAGQTRPLQIVKNLVKVAFLNFQKIMHEKISLKQKTTIKVFGEP